MPRSDVGGKKSAAAVANALTSANSVDRVTIVLDKRHRLQHTCAPRPGYRPAIVRALVAKILVLHGPNLNLLGSREPEIYGYTTLGEIDAGLTEAATASGHELVSLQSNAEHVLIERIHQAKTDKIDIILINPGAFTHTSIALRDAFLSVKIPFIEVHLSNVLAREKFRRHSYLSDVAVGLITGFGADSYRLALEAAVARLKKSS